MNKKELKKERIKNHIIQNAKKIFSQKGYRDTTIEDIVEQALISKGTLYLYFKNKENLFLETMQDSFSHLISLLENHVLSPEISVSQRLKKLFKTLLQYFEKDYYLIHIIFYRDLDFNEKIIEFMDHFVDKMTEVIARILEKCGLKLLEAKQLAFSLIGTGYIYITTWYVENRKTSQKKHLENLNIQDIYSIYQTIYNQFKPYIIQQIKKQGV